MIKKFLRLKFSDQRNFVLAGIALTFAYILIYALPTPLTLKFFKKNIHRRGLVTHPPSNRETEAAECLLKLVRNLPFEPSCLAICCAYCLRLAPYKIYPHINLGFDRIARIAEIELSFHAWIVVSAELIIGERQDLARYNVISRKPGLPSSTASGRDFHV